MPETKQQKLRVFLCHADEDKPKVRKLYKQLLSDGYDAWFDEEKLKPGADWKLSIDIAMRESQAVIICLSTASVKKEGYVNVEILNALDIAKEKPEGTIFIIPLRLDDCEVPYRFRNIQWTNLFSNGGYERVCDSLNERFGDVKKKEYGNTFLQWVVADKKFSPKFTRREQENKLKVDLFIWYVFTLGTAFFVYLLNAAGGNGCTVAFLLIFIQWAVINKYTTRSWVWFAVNLLLISSIYLLPFLGLGSYININPNSVPPVIVNPTEMRISVALWTIWLILNAVIAPYIVGQVGKFLISQRQA
jgi:hypothetical protein